MVVCDGNQQKLRHFVGQHMHSLAPDFFYLLVSLCICSLPKECEGRLSHDQHISYLL